MCKYYLRKNNLKEQKKKKKIIISSEKMVQALSYFGGIMRTRLLSNHVQQERSKVKRYCNWGGGGFIRSLLKFREFSELVSTGGGFLEFNIKLIFIKDSFIYYIDEFKIHFVYFQYTNKHGYFNIQSGEYLSFLFVAYGKGKCY